MYLVEVDEAIFILDVGLVYPEHELLGIDAVIPDFSYLEENKDRVLGIFLSHGHDDAIGALPYLLEVVDAPVFGTEFTVELAKLHFDSKERESLKNRFYIINAENEIEFEQATVSFFSTTHTIPDSVGIVIETKEGNIVYTSDFKFDPSAKGFYKTDYNRLTEIGKQGTLALLSDSANAEFPMLNLKDSLIVEKIRDTLVNYKGRVIIASIGSNIARIQQILDAAYQAKRKVFISTNQAFEIIDVAIKLGKITIPSRKVIGQMRDLKKTPAEQVVLLETGDVGEPIQSIQLMARGRHRHIRLDANDLVYLATTPSTAMETIMTKTKDAIYRAGAKVASITEGASISGHATQNDLQMMIDIIQPKYIFPVNGEMRALHAHALLAQEMGYEDTQIFITSIGDVVEYNNHRMQVTSEVPAGNVLVDGIGVGDIGNVVLRDRRILSEDGIFVIVATISRRLGKVLVGPQITSRGFVYMKASTELISECSDMTLDVLEAHLSSNDFDWGELKSDLREKIGKFLYKETKRRPVVLPIIMDASGYQPKK